MAKNIFDTFSQDERWMGWGYLQGRQSAAGQGFRSVVELVDEFVLFTADSLGWSDEELFTWANSKNGRWFSDSTLHSWTSIETLPGTCNAAVKYIKLP